MCNVDMLVLTPDEVDILKGEGMGDSNMFHKYLEYNLGSCYRQCQQNLGDASYHTQRLYDQIPIEMRITLPDYRLNAEIMANTETILEALKTFKAGLETIPDEVVALDDTGQPKCLWDQLLNMTKKREIACLTYTIERMEELLAM